MSRTAGTLAIMVGGELQGDPDRSIQGVAALERAGSLQISFVQDERQVSRLKNCRAGAVIAPPRLATAAREACPELTLILTENPQAAFETILDLFQPQRQRPPRGIMPGAFISPTATIGNNCYIAPGAFIGDEVTIGDNCDIHPGAVIQPGCTIGNDTIIHPNVVLYADVSVGSRVIIHANAVFGADGFSYRLVNGRLEKIPQRGTVEIHDDVEIGAGAMADRAMIGATIIGEGSKIDNMVMIGHNCEIGRHNVFASQVGMAGSCKTGDYVRLGGQVGIKDHVTLNTGCQVGAKAAVHKDIPTGETWIGYPATPEGEQKRLVFSLRRVPEMRDQLKQLKKDIAQLTEQLAALESQKPPLRAAG